jgi:4-hydroxy-2-oxoheptanedioate aldolase
MKDSRIIERLAQGRPIIGTMAKVTRSPEIAPLAAAAGFDFIIVDTEHYAFNSETVSDIIRSARGTDIDCIVRTAGKAPFLLSLPLDYGAQGLLVPRVDTRDEALGIVRETKYYPSGLRGMSVLSGHSDYEKTNALQFMQQRNSQTLIIAEIESKLGVENIDDIATVAGIDAVFIGPHDLAQSLGIPGDLRHAKMTEAIDLVLASCQRHGIAAAMQVYDMDSARHWLEHGVQILSYKSDLAFFLDGASSDVGRLRLMP